MEHECLQRCCGSCGPLWIHLVRSREVNEPNRSEANSALDQWEVSNLLSFSSLLGKSCRDAHPGSIWVQLEPQTLLCNFLVHISSVHSRGTGSLGEAQALHPELLRSCAQPEQSDSSAGELPLFNDCHHTGHWEHPLRNRAVFILLCFCQALFSRVHTVHYSVEC